MEPTDLNRIVKTVLQDLDLMIVQNNATIKVDPLPVIEAIPLQMTQLFYNLINNSLKFLSTERTAHITISCRKLKAEEKHETLLSKSDYYEISINDNGIGFNEEYAHQISVCSKD